MATDYKHLLGEAKSIVAKQLQLIEENRSTLIENNPPQTPHKPLHNPCSLQWCENGHCWAPQLAIPHCQGCQNPLIGLRMSNCPVCNEPVVKTQLRIDHLGSAHPITKTCKQEYHVGPEYIFVEIDHKHNTWIAKGSVKTDSTQQTVQVGVQKLEGSDIESTSRDSNGELDGRVQPV